MENETIYLIAAIVLLCIANIYRIKYRRAKKENGIQIIVKDDLSKIESITVECKGHYICPHCNQPIYKSIKHNCAQSIISEVPFKFSVAISDPCICGNDNGLIVNTEGGSCHCASCGGIIENN